MPKIKWIGLIKEEKMKDSYWILSSNERLSSGRVIKKC